MGLRITRHCSWWDLYTWICRVWGILTFIGLWGVGIEVAVRGYMLGIYLLVSAVIMTFFELHFVILFWLEICWREETPASHGCVETWRRLEWVDNWKKGVLYLLMCVGCFIRPKIVWIATVSGVMILICSVLYFIKTIKWRQDKREEELRAKNQTYDRFDEVQDDIDDNVLDSVTDQDQPIYNPESLAEQDEILDV